MINIRLSADTAQNGGVLLCEMVAVRTICDMNEYRLQMYFYFLQTVQQICQTQNSIAFNLHFILISTLNTSSSLINQMHFFIVFV